MYYLLHLALWYSYDSPPPLPSFVIIVIGGQFSDQYQYLRNCPPTPPLTQQQSIDNKSGLMLG